MAETESRRDDRCRECTCEECEAHSDALADAYRRIKDLETENTRLLAAVQRQE